LAEALTMVLTETRGGGAVFLGGPGESSDNRIPEGTVALERLQDVEASDGRIGQMSGICIDRSDERLTRLVVAEGHLWSRKRVTLPIGSVVEFAEAVHLALSTDQARSVALPYE
jgi:hypothetical protein